MRHRNLCTLREKSLCQAITRAVVRITSAVFAGKRDFPINADATGYTVKDTKLVVTFFIELAL